MGLAGPLAGGSHSSYAVLTCGVGWTQGFGFSFVNGDGESKDFEWGIDLSFYCIDSKASLV